MDALRRTSISWLRVRLPWHERVEFRTKYVVAATALYLTAYRNIHFIIFIDNCASTNGYINNEIWDALPSSSLLYIYTTYLDLKV